MRSVNVQLLHCQVADCHVLCSCKFCSKYVLISISINIAISYSGKIGPQKGRGLARYGAQINNDIIR